MSKPEQAAQGSAATAKPKHTQYNSKSGAQKMGHICKVCVFLLTMGFAYPNILND